MRLVCPVEIAAAGRQQAVLPGQLLKVRDSVFVIARIPALDAHQAAVHAVLDQLAQARVVQVVLEGMGQHRHAVGLPDDLHRAFDGQDAPGHIVSPALFHIFVKGLGDASGQTELHQDPGKVRPSDHRAKALVHLLIAHRQTVGGHQVRHFFVSVIPVLDHPVQRLPHGRSIRVDVIAQNMDRLAEFRADLDPGDDLHAVCFAGARSLRAAAHVVVIRDRHGAQPGLRGELHRLGRCKGAVRCGGMHM